MFSKETFEKVGVLLKEARVAKKLSQREVSSQLGYTSPQFISNIERGLCMPPLRQLKVMIELYDLDAREMADLIMQAQSEFIHKQLGLVSGKKKSGRHPRK